MELNQPDNATCPSCLLRQPTDLETNHFLSQIFVLEREALERRKKSSWVRVIFQAWFSWFDPLDSCFEVRTLIYFDCCYWSSSCIAWSDSFCMSCIALKLVLKRENGFSYVLEEKPRFDPKVGTKTMFLCLFLHDHLIWTPRSIFWTLGMKTQIFVTSCELASIFHWSCSSYSSKENPDFSWLCLTGPRLSPGRYLVCFLEREQWLSSQLVLPCLWLGSG